MSSSYHLVWGKGGGGSARLEEGRGGPSSGKRSSALGNSIGAALYGDSAEWGVLVVVARLET